VPLLACLARLTDLAHLPNGGQSTDQFLLCHLLQRHHVDMFQPSMPPLSLFFTIHDQTLHLCQVDVEHIELVLAAHYSCQQLSARLTDAHDTLLDVDVIAGFIQLSHIDDVRHEPRNVVHRNEGSLLSIPSFEHHHVAPFDLNH
jgi:hypothetical protein